MTPTSLILVGGGGHCRSCIDVVEQTGRYQIAGIVDVPERVGDKVLDWPIIAADADLPDLARENHRFLITLGQIKTPEPRARLFRLLAEAGAKLATVVSPRAYVSPRARIGKGTIVMHRAIVNAGASVGDNCIVNSGAVVEHDARISDHCHISTCAVVNGGVRIGTGVFFGSSAVAREYIEIGGGSFIGANRTVTGNLPDHSVIK